MDVKKKDVKRLYVYTVHDLGVPSIVEQVSKIRRFQHLRPRTMLALGRMREGLMAHGRGVAYRTLQNAYT